MAKNKNESPAGSAAQLLTSGEKHFQQNDLELAEQHFLKALEIDPNLADAHNNLGVIAWQNNHPKKSVEYFKQALSINPQHKDALTNLQEIIRLLGKKSPPDHTEKIRIADDIEVTVPISDGLMTPFVLKEQRDWFEDEIAFIRNFIQPGMTVIDIGANYGLYTLTCAKRCGRTGHVWAFEPTGSVARCLNDSLATNGFSNATLVHAGLSNKNGEARLSLHPNAELNSLNSPIPDNGNYEVITLKTLDDCAMEYNWEKIDFIKLDAEGEEVRILEGATRTLEKFSPPIMYELKHGEAINLPLINAFKQHGYAPYYLVPGPQLLIPFDADTALDGFLLNLFAIKEQTARRLKREQKLIVDMTALDAVPMDDLPEDLWPLVMGERRFSAPFMGQWVERVKTGKDPYIKDLTHALNLYAYYLIGIHPEKRLKALLQCEKILAQLSENTPGPPFS